MSITLKFGLPGSGKTTLMVYDAIQGVISKRYSNVYCNVPISVPGVTHIDNECIGKYLLVDGLLLIDEATLFADSREFKTFGKERTEFFMMHRHFNLDIVLYAQQWNSLDLKIRSITDRVYYVHKGIILGPWFTSYYRIPYGIIIPDPHKKQGGEKLGEIIQGYCKPTLFQRIFMTKRLFRPKYYKYFDSWNQPYRPPLPDHYHTYTHLELEEKLAADRQKSKWNKMLILLRSKIEKKEKNLNEIIGLTPPNPIAE